MVIVTPRPMSGFGATIPHQAIPPGRIGKPAMATGQFKKMHSLSVGLGRQGDSLDGERRQRTISQPRAAFTLGARPLRLRLRSKAEPMSPTYDRISTESQGRKGCIDGIGYVRG